MRDIARDLNVSAITVSKALRHHKDISVATRERVLQRSRELNYQPNLAARSLATGRSFLVGLIVPDLVHPFFGEIAKSISSVLRRSGYSLMIASSEEDPRLEVLEIEVMLGRSVDALILASTVTLKRGGALQKVATSGIPLVLLERRVRGVQAEFVGVDDELLGMTATRHLVERGCRRIAHIGGPPTSPGVDRRRGFERVLLELKMAAKPEWVVKTASADARGTENGYTAMQQLLKLRSKPDGVFCFNDEIAIGALRACLDAGLAVPQDVAIIGVGNMKNTDFLKVPLSTIDPNSTEIGKRAARIALNLIANPTDAAPCSTMIPVQLIERASTAR